MAVRSPEVLEPAVEASAVTALHALPPAPPKSPPAALSVAERAGLERESWWARWHLVAAAGTCWALLLLAFLLDHLTAAPHPLIVALYVLAYLAGGARATKDAVTDLAHGTVNIDLLMVTAAVGAAIVNAWAEGAVLLGLFSTSGALEHLALGRTRTAVRALMELSPAVATVVRPDLPGGEATVPIERVALGDLVLVRPGERVAVDGEVVAGESAIDQAAITGESMPVTKRPGDPVFAASMNGTGAIRVRVTRLAHESTLATIVRLVEEAQEQKSRAQRFADAFEGKYALGVIAAAILATIIPTVGFGVALSDAFYRAMTLLVVASPCALVISTPASTLAALANAARHGILVKGAGYLEDIGAIRVVAFDKTGTLTGGAPRLTDIVPLDPTTDPDTLLRLAAAAERLSEHPLGRAIVAAAAERGLALPEVEEFRSVPGKGIVARVGERLVAVGNEALFAELGVAVSPAAVAAADQLRAAGKTVPLVGDESGVRGVLAVADTVRPAAAAAVREIKRLGVRRTVMLTGDRRPVAEAIAAQVGIDEIYADLLPADKLEVIRRLEAASPGGVAMIGDGVNDAPALATARVGVAMGAAGTDVALETADVVLMSDDLTRLPYALALSRRTRRTIRQNLTFSLAVIAMLVTATLTIGIPLPLGVVGHEGSTIIVVLNGLRLLGTRRRR